MTETRTGYAEINGARLYYEVAGTGYPLALVHAGIADSRMWDEQFAVFAQHYQVIRYDMSGYGKTAMVAREFSHRQDLYGLMKFLSVERAFLLGCSMGGKTATDFALEHPDRVAALVLVGADLSGYEDTGDPPRQWDEMVAAYQQKDFERLSELEVQIWVDGETRTPEQVNPAVRQRVLGMNIIALRNSALKLGKEQPIEPPAIARLAEIRVPTLVVVGDLDHRSILEIADLLTTGIPGARKVVMSGTAHVPSMEQPGEFNRLVVEFLADLPKSY